MKRLFFKFSFFLFIFCFTVFDVNVFCVEQVLKIAMNSVSSYTFDNRQFNAKETNFIMSMLGSGLVHLEREGNFVPALAESIDVSDDSMRYVFHLKECYWSDGDRITANDFEYGWKTTYGKKYLYNNPGAESNSFFYAQDPQTFVVNLEFWAPFFFELLDLAMFYPVKDDIDNKKPGWQLSCEDYPSSGPFVFKERDDGNYLIFKKNPLYWDNKSVKLDEVRLLFINDGDTALDLFLNEDIDWYGTPINVSISNVKLNSYGLKKNEVLSRCTGMIHVNVQKGILRDKNFRKALYYALNRKKICEKVLGEGDRPAATILLAHNSVKNRDDIVNGKNVKLAREFFDKSLKDNGISSVSEIPKITLQYESSNMNNLIMESCQKQWNKAFGIMVELIPEDKGTLLGNNNSGNYDMAYIPLTCCFDDPTLIFSIFNNRDANKNFAKWKNDDFISLYWKSKEARGKEELNKIMDEMENIFDDEMPAISILYSSEGYLKNPKLKDVFIPHSSNLKFHWSHFEEV